MRMGRKCSKYFLSLEKRNATRKSVQSLKANGRVITSKKEILQTFSENLRTKYCKDTTTVNAKEYVKKNVRRKLSNMQKHALDAPLSLSALHMALMKMKKGKSPGTNSFTSDFFRHFRDVLGVFLFRACKEGLQNKTLINSHRESVVTLIPKQGKPHDSMKGWRPISLLNVDFKIILSAIANRLKTVMCNLISPAQTAYIPGRFIGDNSRIMYDIIEYVNATSTSGIIMAVDFEAAFDTVSWEFLIEALDCYNFGPPCYTYDQNILS